MAALDAATFNNVMTATLDFHMRGQPMAQNIAARPLLKLMKDGQRKFPGGAQYITVNVKAVGGVSLVGIQGDDTLSFSAPKNAKRANWRYADHFCGISFVREELLRNGIVINDEGTGDSQTATVLSGADKIQLFNLLNDRAQELSEGFAIGLNDLLWSDGTSDSKALAGIRSVIVDDPTAAVQVGGLDQSALAWWRNHANLAVNASQANATDGVLIRTLDRQIKLCKKYAPDAKLVILAGFDFIEQLKNERFAKGSFTLDGFAGKQDVSNAEIRHSGIDVVWDPTLDGMTAIEGSKRAYIIDTNAIQLGVIEDMRMHYPDRQHDKFVYYRGATFVGGLIATRRNSSAILKIA